MYKLGYLSYLSIESTPGTYFLGLFECDSPIRAATSSFFSGNELFRVTYFELHLVWGSEINQLELYELLKFF